MKKKKVILTEEMVEEILFKKDKRTEGDKEFRLYAAQSMLEDNPGIKLIDVINSINAISCGMNFVSDATYERLLRRGKKQKKQTKKVN